MLNILIVDDISDNLFTLNALLDSFKEEYGFKIKVHQANSGDKALKIALKEDMDIIILDIQMPNMNGFETAKYLKSNSKTKYIPIVFLTAVFKSEEFIKNGYDIGAIDYLLKPIQREIFTKKMKNHITMIIDQKKNITTKEYFKELSLKTDDLRVTLDSTTHITHFNNNMKKIFPHISLDITIFQFANGIENIQLEEKNKLLGYLNNLNIFMNLSEKTILEYQKNYYSLNFEVLKDGYLFVLKNITKEYQMALENERIKEEYAKEIEITKEKMLMIFTHELKTPLNGIIGFSGHIQRGLEKGITSKNQPRYIKLAKTVEALGKSMLGNITSMLDLSKLKDGKLVLDNTTFELSQVIKESTQVFALIYEDKIVQFDMDSVEVVSDKGMIRHIVENIFTNALKYGESKVLVKLNQQGDRFSYIVEDDGPGIDLKMREKIFNLFEQGDNQELTRDKEGTGIGLHLVKKLCDTMDYEITISSSEDLGGAKFIVKGKIE